MTLIACLECGHKVSDTADACPNCGAKVRTKRWSRTLVITFLAVPTALAMAVAGFTYANRPPWEIFQEVAQNEVKKELKDPESAIFGESFVISSPLMKDGIRLDAYALCGVVNGRNTFGAYTGGTRFIARGLAHKKSAFVTSVIFEDSDRRATVTSAETDKKATIFEEIYWNKECVDSKHHPTYSGKAS